MPSSKHQPTFISKQITHLQRDPRWLTLTGVQTILLDTPVEKPLTIGAVPEVVFSFHLLPLRDAIWGSFSPFANLSSPRTTISNFFFWVTHVINFLPLLLSWPAIPDVSSALPWHAGPGTFTSIGINHFLCTKCNPISFSPSQKSKPKLKKVIGHHPVNDESTPIYRKSFTDSTYSIIFFLLLFFFFGMGAGIEPKGA